MLMPPKVQFSYGGVATLASTNSNRVVDARYEDFAVADAAGVGGGADRLDGLFDHLVFDDQLDLHLGKEVDDILGPTVEFGVTLLPAEPLGLQNSDAFEADLIECILHFVELEGLDDRFDLLHSWKIPARKPRCCRPGQPVQAPRQQVPCHNFPQVATVN